MIMCISFSSGDVYTLIGSVQFVALHFLYLAKEKLLTTIIVRRQYLEKQCNCP